MVKSGTALLVPDQTMGPPMGTYEAVQLLLVSARGRAYKGLYGPHGELVGVGFDFRSLTPVREIGCRFWIPF